MFAMNVTCQPTMSDDMSANTSSPLARIDYFERKDVIYLVPFRISML